MTSAGRDLLLAHLSEVDWSAQVAEWARRGGWCGVHIRRSLTTGQRGFSVLQGIHTLRNSDHDDGRGLPDWLFARRGSPLLTPELKTVVGHVDRDQERWLAVLGQATGVSAPVWRPDQEEEVKRVLGVVA